MSRATIRRSVWFVAALLSLWALRANVSPDFTPIRSELTGAHGFSRGVLNFVVLSAGQPFGRMPVWSIVLCAAVFLLLARSTKWGGPYKVRPAYLVRLKPDTTYEGADTTYKMYEAPAWVSMIAGAASVFLLAVALSPYVTPYRVVLAPRTFALCLLLVCAPRAFGMVRPVAKRWTPVLTAAAAAAFFASALLQTLAAFDGNYSGFLHVSRDVAARAPFLQERPDLARSIIVDDAGYDGQFMYLMTFDPFLRRFADRPQEYRAFIDNPPYRYGRIGFSVLTKLVSAGRPERYPAAMVWLIVAAHFVLAALLALVARNHGLSPIAGLWYLAIPSFTSSLMSALPEALAAAAMVAGFFCWEQRRPGLAALSVLSFGVALLIRETGVILLVALVLASGAKEWKRSMFVLGASLAPVAVWRLYVGSRLFDDFGWGAVVASPGDFGAPFGGLLHLWRAGFSGVQPQPEISGALLFPLILTMALILSVRLLVLHTGPLEIAAVAYAIVAVSLNYGKIWSHLPSGERGTFELFLCLLLLLLESRGRPVWIRRVLTGFFVVLLGYTFLVAPDAATSRAALLLIR